MATYYVDFTGGNDGNTGLATDQAWKTTGKVSTELAAGTFGAGDSVLFKRGETWTVSTHMLFRNCAGVTLGYYGSGAKPILNANNTNTYILYRGVGDASADGSTVENWDCRNTTSKAALYMRDVDDLTISACEFTSNGIGIQVRNADDCTIDGCTIYSADEEAIYVGNAGDWTQKVNRLTISNCEVYDTQYDMIDFKEGTYDSIIEDCHLEDGVLISNSSPPQFISLGGIGNTVRRTKVVMDDSYTENGIQVGQYITWLDPGEDETAHTVSQCQFLDCPSESGIYVYGDGNTIWDNALIGCIYGIEIDTAGMGTANKQHLRGNYFSGSTNDDVNCDTTSMTDSDYNCYNDAGSWDIGGSSRTLSYVRATYGFEENSRPYISIQPGTSVYVNDIVNVTNGDGMIYVDVTYRLYGVAQHRTSHVMRLGNSDEWRHEILMNFKLYIDRDSNFSTRAADDRDTDISTDANDPEGIIADAGVAALIGAETWLYYDA